MTLKLDGKPFVKDVIPPAQQRAIDLLLKSPIDEIFSMTEMGDKHGLGKDMLIKVAGRRTDITYLWRQRRYFGNPKAIAAFVKQVSE